VYLRVSSTHQTVEHQRADVEQLARARGFEPVIYEEVGSAAKKRPVFERMMADVRAGRVQAVACWAMDRLSRQMEGSISTVLECDRLNVPVLSVKEGWLDMGGPTRPLLIYIFSWVAEQERQRLIDRTNAGLATARRKGTRLGRPKCSPVKLAAAAARVDQGASIREASAACGVGFGTLRRHLASAA
jgi:DNA invertase Pin-like site-specific DNA recombinase